MRDYIKPFASSTIAKSEDNDCAIRALSMATGEDYDTCHYTLAELGRKPRGRCRDEDVDDAIDILGFKANRSFPRSRTVRTMMRYQELSKNKRYMVRVNGHYFAVVNGEIQGDWMKNNRMHRIMWVYEITPGE